MTVGDFTETGGPSDGDATLMGSMNWTNAAARNSEDLNLVASRPVAEA
jgi:hypothetical protein